MPIPTLPTEPVAESQADAPRRVAPASLPRLKSEDLFRQGREVEIEHAGRIYRMRLTNQNKLILTA